MSVRSKRKKSLEGDDILPKPINSMTSLSAARSSSCLHISAILRSFLMPTASRPSSRKPACSRRVMALEEEAWSGNKPTSLITTSKDRSVSIGGTRMSAANVSDIPMSCNIVRLDDVANTNNLFPFGGRLPNSTISACSTPLENLGPIGTQSIKQTNTSQRNPCVSTSHLLSQRN